MPVIDSAAYAEAEATQGGGFQQVTPGAYVLKVVEVLTEWEEYDRDFGGMMRHHTRMDQKDMGGEERVKLVYDIAEGDLAGEYSREFYMDGDRPAANKCWMHWCDYQWSHLGKLKNFNEVLAACNPGFDPMAALTADRWEMFRGRRFGAVLNGTVKTNDNGYDDWTCRCSAQIITVQDVHDGNYKEPRITDNRNKSGGGQAASPAADDDYVPF